MRYVVVVVVALLGAGAYLVFGGVLDDGTAGRYRLAAVEVGDVARTVSASGTVDFVNRADVAFAVPGTLTELTVSAGDEVTAGQTLAAVDDAQPRAAVESATAELADAEATLETDQQRQQDTVDAPAGDEDTARLQDAVRAAQSAATTALAAAKAALAAQRRACAEPTRDPTTEPVEGAATAEPDPPPAASGECSDALAAATAAQEKVAAAQETLQRGIADLAAALSEVDNPESRSPQEETPTAATIAADQAAVDRARAALVAAERDLDQTTLTAPVAGTVASVTAAEGDQVTAGDPVLVVIGPGAALVETTVPVDRVADLEVGQPATVTPTGSATTVEGTVSRIGRLATEKDGQSAYPVTVTVEQPPATMPAGSPAGVDIVVGTADGVLTVPTSAVTSGRLVTVLTGDQATPQIVELGIVGARRTEVRDGLAEGDQVVLADLERPLPSSGQQTGPTGGPMGGGPMVIRAPGPR